MSSTIGNKIDSLFVLREEKRGHEQQIKAIQERMALLETELIEQMKSEGVSKSTGLRASVGISSSVKPNVKNWDSFYAYIHKHKYYHLLERRPSVTGCRELFETKGKIPGVEPYVAEVLQLRSINEVPT